MKKILLLLLALGTVAGVRAQTAPMNSSALQRSPKNDRSGTSWYVRAADGPLLFTKQIVAGNLSGDARTQAGLALDQLTAVLKQEGADLSHVARLNAYVADPASTAEVDAVIAARFASALPSVVVVCTPLHEAGAKVAFDAIAALPAAANPASSVRITAGGNAVMATGGKVFVSGQAHNGPGLGVSAKNVMQNLFKALEHVGQSKADVVQVKAFIKPFTDHQQAIDEVKASFAPAAMPPLVLVEWTTGSPSEIELVAAAPKLTRPIEDAAAYVSLPGMTTSPFFARVTTVAAGAPLIFTAGFDGGDTGTAREQWKRAYDQLGNALFDSGSSFRHMVKATYYLFDDKAREQLGAIRTVFYDPTPPPAASPHDLTKVARPGRKVMVDIIAVPVK
jgi:enamine deaminase RidA (YjgF/YER057c/UK114 family)